MRELWLEGKKYLLTSKMLLLVFVLFLLNITKLFYYKNGFKRAIAELILPVAMKKHRAIEPSMLQDLKKGKPCEIDAINGVVCEWGRKCGVPTPINDRIVEIVKKEQAGELPLEEKNIRFFDDLL